MGTKRTAEFRQEAIRVALTSGLTRKQVAADFGIHCQTGHVYMPEMGLFNIEQLDTTRPKNPEKPSAQSDLEREIVGLRKENRLLREEREVLKKATQFFASQKP